MNDKVLGFYEAVHQKELDYKETLLSRVQVTAALFLTNATAFVYMVRNLDFSSQAIFIHYFYLSSAVNLLGLFVAGYFLAKAFSSSEYKTLPTLARIDKYIEELKEYNNSIDKYNSENQTDEPKVVVESKLAEYLKGIYIDCATFNSTANERRSSFSYRSVQFTFFSFIPLFISSVLFISNDMDASSSRKPVEFEAKKIEDVLKDINQVLIESKKVNVCQKSQNSPLHQLNLSVHVPEFSGKVTYHQNQHQHPKKETNNVCAKPE